MAHDYIMSDDFYIFYLFIKVGIGCLNINAEQLQFIFLNTMKQKTQWDINCFSNEENQLENKHIKAHSTEREGGYVNAFNF